MILIMYFFFDLLSLTQFYICVNSIIIIYSIILNFANIRPKESYFILYIINSHFILGHMDASYILYHNT